MNLKINFKGILISAFYATFIYTQVESLLAITTSFDCINVVGDLAPQIKKDTSFVPLKAGPQRQVEYDTHGKLLSGDSANNPSTNSGGMGVVERGFIPGKADAVAIKRAKAQKDEENMQREIQILKIINAESNRPNELPIYYGNNLNAEWQTELYVDWVVGENFLSKHNTPLNSTNYVEGTRDVLRQLQRLLSALDWIHERGILHLDVKGANVMVRENTSIKLIDFGIAARYNKAEGGGLIDPAIGFTEVYASPEYRALFAGQVKKMLADPEFSKFKDLIGKEKVGPKSDVYSVGIMLQFWLLKQMDSKTKDWPANMPEKIKAQYAMLAYVAAKMTEFSVSHRIGAKEAIYELGHVAQQLN